MAYVETWGLPPHPTPPDVVCSLSYYYTTPHLKSKIVPHHKHTEESNFLPNILFSMFQSLNFISFLQFLFIPFIRKAREKACLGRDNSGSSKPNFLKTPTYRATVTVFLPKTNTLREKKSKIMPMNLLQLPRYGQAFARKLTPNRIKMVS